MFSNGVLRAAGILLAAAWVGPVVASEKPLPFGGVRFEENRGQAARQVRYLARARGQQVFFTDSGLRFATNDGAVVEMTFAGAGRARWTAEGEAAGTISYMVGRDAAQWVKGAPMFDRVVWRGVYPGIDVAFYGQGDRLEYDLIIGPGADWRRVDVRLTGGGTPELKRDGTVEVGKALRQRAPEIYQESAEGVRTHVVGGFRQEADGSLRLALGEYARERKVVVDPVLETAGYIGGENDDEVVALAEGLVAGNTRSLAFPPGSPMLRGGRDAFLMGVAPVVSMSSRGFLGILVFGGSGDDQVTALASSRSGGYAYVAGTTTSTDLPLAGQSKYKGGATDGFITIVSYSGYRAYVSLSVYVGGSGEDRVNGIAMNDSQMVVVGSTTSWDLAGMGAPYDQYRGGVDAFFALGGIYFQKAPVAGYLGGAGEDVAYAVDISRTGTIWIGGETRSGDFGFANGALSGASDGFLAALTTGTASGSAPAPARIATYRVGGSGEDAVRAVAARPATVSNVTSALTPFTVDAIAFGGITNSADLPVRNAAQTAFGGERDGFLGAWNAADNAPAWLTYVGGTAADEITAVTENWAGDVVAGGWTRSTDLRVVGALQEKPGGGEDGLFAIYDSTGPVRHLGYYGGSGDDRIRAVRMTGNDLARLAGSTTSTDLPEVAPVLNLSRGERSDGFIADIGCEYLIGPQELIVGKDGVVTFSVRTGRTSFREQVTYRTKDPSKARLVYLGRSFDEVTAAAEADMGVEALAGSGEAELEVTAAGYATKTIRIKLYPSAFMVSATSPVVSTWSAGFSVYATFTAIDPATGQAVGPYLTPRPGLGVLNYRWSVSDATVVEAVGLGRLVQLRALRPGDVVLNLEVAGFTVLPLGGRMTVASPSLLMPKGDYRLGQNLIGRLPVVLGINGVAESTGARGTLTARSGDPAKLLISTSQERPGGESATVRIGPYAGLWAYALADSGTVPVIFTSTEFAGEARLDVTLEPTVIRWGVRNTSVANAPLLSETSLKVSEPTDIIVAAESESGVGGEFRPGAPPVTLRLANSNPRALELNRLTVDLSPVNGHYTARGLAPGRAELRLTSPDASVKIAGSTFSVDVQPLDPWIVPLPVEVPVGKGLQTQVSFRYREAAGAAEVVSDDAAAMTVSVSSKERGSERILVTPSGDTYTFTVHGRRAGGTATLRVRLPNGQQQPIRILLLGGAVGFVGADSAYSANGTTRAVRVGTWAVDLESGVGVFRQPPQPGAKIAVRLRAEGASVGFEPSTFELSPETSEKTVAFTVTPAGQAATLIAEADGDFASSVRVTRLRLGGQRPAPGTWPVFTMMKDALASTSITVPEGGRVTLTSSDPDRLLISPTEAEAPSATFTMTRTGSVFLHALAGSGEAKIVVETSGQPAGAIRVAFQPLQVEFYSMPAIPVGGTAQFTGTTGLAQFRPGAGPYRLEVRTADARVATVETPPVELGGAATSVNVRVRGVAAGMTQLLVDGPPDVYITPAPLPVIVSTGAVESVPTYTVGNNLAGSAQLSLGQDAVNPNGAIVTLTSSNPAKLVMSRSATVAGTGTLSVTAPAGSRVTQSVYFHALEEGEVSIRADWNGASRTLATVRIVPAWWTCGTSPGTDLVSIAVSGRTPLSCSPRYIEDTGNRLQEVAMRPGLGGLTLGVASSDSSIFEVETRSVALDQGAREIWLRGVSPGLAELRLTQPQGFGPDLDGSGNSAIRVLMPPVRTNFMTEFPMGIDTQRWIQVIAPTGVSVTATSSDAALVLVSSDAAAPGSPSVSVTAPAGEGVNFYLQALAAFGTAEVVFSAPGYQELRFALVLRPSMFYLTTTGGDSTLPVRAGSADSLYLNLKSGDIRAEARAGANLSVGLAAVTPGIVTIEPARVVWDSRSSQMQVRIQAVGLGSTAIAITQPQGFSQPVTPFVVSVSP
ncbi:MAG: hypothetical protein IT168_26630 [Bryobacterales bacterium]|nr:hypothetical protein [Bryobacterales bacterium]